MKREKTYYLFSAILSSLVNLGRKAPEEFTGKILIVKLDELGDLITAVPALREIRKSYPKAEISLVLKRYLHSLVAHLDLADRILDPAELFGVKAKLVFELRGNWSLWKWVLRNRPKRYFSRGSLRIHTKRKRSTHPHEVEANLEILRMAGFKVPSPESIGYVSNARSQQNAKLFLQRNVIEKFVILHTGARRKLRRWHPAKYAELASYCIEKLGLDVVFVGSPEESWEIEELMKTIPQRTFSFAGHGELLDYAALVEKAEFMIGNESGPMQIASAVGTKTIALFGPGEPHLFQPWGEKHIVLHHKLHCNPCDQVNCVYPKNPCINLISIEEVTAAIKELTE